MIAERQHRKLLVVDDEPLVRQTLSYCLEDEYDVVAVASGEEAIEASKREAFPVVILDLCMEGISGIETLKHLKKIHESQNVIILTAYESTESAISALNLGAFNYLTKPFERKHLKEVISHGFAVYDQQSLRKQDMQQRLMNVHDAFFSLLCHEFNTPLNIILGYSELLQDNLKNPEHKAWVKDIKDSGAHLHDILMEIVDYIGASHAATAGIHTPFVPEVLLLKIVRDRFPHTVRVLTTAYTEMDLLVEAINTGAVYSFVSKPWEVSELAKTLSGAMSQHESQLHEAALLDQTIEDLREKLLEDRAYDVGLVAAKIGHYVHNALCPVDDTD